jgi:transcriptional regulator with XRE-family HTH domain
MTTPLRTVISRKLKGEVVRRGLDYDQVAARCGLHPRTVERFLEGETFSPETADAIAVGLRIELDDSTEERLLGGLDLWRLHGSPGWWARLGDVAEHVGSARASLVERIDRALASGRIAMTEVRRQVRQDSTVGRPDSCLTRSPYGVTMLSARATLWVLLTAESEQGERAIVTLIDEGLERLRSAGVRR